MICDIVTENSQRLRHKIDWQNNSVLLVARASNDYYLKINKTLLIKERMPIMNNNETSVILNLFLYRPISLRLIALFIHDSLVLTVSFRPTLLLGLNYLYIE